jgi:ornithine cyclodeaminase/alanine dehydrogenase-like protein (mu-crystallin family)
MLFLDRQDVIALLPMTECIAAVERAFAAHADSTLPAEPGVLGSHVKDGGFHIKTAALGTAPGYFAAKINANFPGNPERHGLPTIQGMIGLFDTATGRPLALLDSIEITTLRTAAASAIAARFLARADAATLLICGCGNQGRAHLRALLLVRRLRRVLAHDRNSAQIRAFIREMGPETGLDIEPAEDLADVFPDCDIAVTCTPAREILVTANDIRPGQFIAAVGADSEGKQELDSGVLRSSLVVADIARQAARMGELQHALAAGLMGIGDLHAELGQLITGARPGRSSDDQIFVFDSTGTAVQDVAAAAAVYERARTTRRGRELSLDGASKTHG